MTAKGSAAVRAYILANSRDLISISEESLKEYVFRFSDFLGDDAPGFAKMVYHLRPELKDCYTPYMKGDELKAKLVKRGDLALDQWEIPVFPMYFHEIKRLKGLTIRRYGLKKLPAGLTDIQGLRRLDLGQNELSRLPDDFQNLTQLEHLVLRSNSFSEVPEVLAHLPKLAYIDLSFNPFKTLPAFLSKLPALNELGLHRCHLAAFPPVLKEIPLLVELSISFVRKGDHVKEIVKEILQMRNLRRLYLASYQQAHLPENWDLPFLESLRLDKSDGLVDLPDAIGNCSHLKVLDLDQCSHLTSLPSTIGNLSRLEEINLRGTRISLLPAAFSKLTSLKKLVLPSGKFKDSGAMIAILEQLTALKEIDCAGHRNELFISALKMNFPMILIRD
ncbi:MAG: leucine-rich repeat domain-containing protein [Bacteroidetes bacterium]|nr:leucine-rich repeat domain-containing protein [Bacteroidota bacterium]